MAIVITDLNVAGQETVTTGSCELCMGTMDYTDYDITFKDTVSGREVSYNSLLSEGWGDYRSFPDISNLPALSKAISEDKEARLPYSWYDARDLLYKHLHS